MNTFEQSVIDAVLTHMSDDHGEDNLVIVRANGAPDATDSVMVGMNGDGGVWRVTEHGEQRELQVNWPGGSITERPEIRREVVKLYRASCEALGIEPRQEDGQAPAQRPFSEVIREGSWSDHDDSEGADFMASIMQGVATLDDYTALVVQHYFMYEALEQVIAGVAEHEMFVPFHDENLRRMEALEVDLVQLVGDDWREEIQAVPATRAYADRILEVGAEGWIPGIIAHHYTRYLGDLSGGQMISKRMIRQHEFVDGKGVAFYNFAQLGSLPEFKGRYRDALDALGLQLAETEQRRVVDEVRKAYAFNTAVFIDLARARDQK